MQRGAVVAVGGAGLRAFGGEGRDDIGTVLGGNFDGFARVHVAQQGFDPPAVGHRGRGRSDGPTVTRPSMGLSPAMTGWRFSDACQAN